MELKRIKSNNEELLVLNQVINEYYKLDMNDKTRRWEYVQARMVFSKMARELGYSLGKIGQYLSKHHSSVIYCINTLENLMPIEPKLDRDYAVCKDTFYSKRDPDTETMGENDMKKELFLLRKKTAEMKMELYELNAKNAKYERVKDIIMVVEERTPKGEEEFIMKKIMAMYNGITFK